MSDGTVDPPTDQDIVNTLQTTSHHVGRAVNM